MSVGDDDKITCWMDFAERIQNWLGSDRIFRGVRDASYELVPKIGRPETRKRGTYRERLETQLFEIFCHEARAFVIQTPATAGEWLYLAQHHGLPTRLLDWTFSPLVAAFFAVENDSTKGDAAIYAAQLPDERYFIKDKDPFEFDKIVLLFPSHISQRIGSQSAIFTIHPDPTEPYLPQGLEKHVIDANYRIPLRQTLALLGITRATLFPGLDGLSGKLTWDLCWRMELAEEKKIKS